MNEKQMIDAKILAWKRRLKLAVTMLEKYEAKAKRLDRKAQLARPKDAAAAARANARLFKF